MKNKMLSPLTKKKGNTKLVYEFDSDGITEDYKSININVSRFFKEEKTCLYKCKETGYRFYYPFSTVGDAEFYEDLSRNKSNYYSERWEHGATMNHLNSSDSVLEIGSGFGAFLKQLVKRNIKACGLELNPHAVDKCKNEGLDVSKILIQDIKESQKKSYSAVCYFQVLEHIVDVNDFIGASIDALATNGKLIIGVPNNNPYIFVNDKYHTLNLPPHHAGLWDEKSLRSLEKLFPLELVSMEFEPLDLSYKYFIRLQMTNRNLVSRTVLKVFNKVAPSILKKLVCKFVNGRNALAVYRKIDK